MSNPPKTQLSYSIKDFYKDYKKVQRLSDYPRRTYPEYRSYVREVFSEIFNQIIKHEWHFILPYGMGEFYLRTNRRRVGSSVIDWDKTRETGKYVYSLNNHSFRDIFKFKWDKTYIRKFPNSIYYNFTLLKGDKKYHKEYNIGGKAIQKHIMIASEDPMIRMPNTYNKPTLHQQDLPSNV